MKNSKPFVSKDQVITLEERIKSILGEDAQIYVFEQSLQNVKDKIQGLSISHNHYEKINVELAKKLTEDLDNIWVNLENSTQSETLFALATKADMQKWYDSVYKNKAYKELCDLYYRDRRFTISEEEIDEFLETWYKNHTKFTI